MRGQGWHGRGPVIEVRRHDPAEPVYPPRRGDRRREDGLSVLRAWGSSGRLDSREISVHGSFCKPEALRPSIASRRNWPVRRPSSRKFISTVVSGGRQDVTNTSQLSNPTTATSSGTLRPDSRMVSAVPLATWALPQKIASTDGSVRS